MTSTATNDTEYTPLPQYTITLNDPERAQLEGVRVDLERLAELVSDISEVLDHKKVDLVMLRRLVRRTTDLAEIVNAELDSAILTVTS